MEQQNVENLLLNLDGTLIFKIKVPGDSNTMEAARDGTQWQWYVPSSQKGFTGARRIAKCSGMHQCPSKHCSFLKEFSQPNTTQFIGSRQKRNCMHCNTRLVYVPCSARKIGEIPKADNTVAVYHYGIHT